MSDKDFNKRVAKAVQDLRKIEDRLQRVERSLHGWKLALDVHSLTVRCVAKRVKLQNALR